MPDDRHSTPDPSSDLARLVGETHATDASRARARLRSLRQQATEEATFAGVLVDLAEECAEVVCRTRAGRNVSGTVVIVGRDFVAVRSPSGPDTLVALAALSAVRRRPGHAAPDATGSRPAPRAVGLAAYLAGLAPDRPRVGVVVDGEPAMLCGVLRAVGDDVATVRLDGEPAVTAYVALASVSEVAVLASG